MQASKRRTGDAALNATQPRKTNVVLLGAGHAHAMALRDFALNPLAEASLP
jgi:hypothetical protein